MIALILNVGRLDVQNCASVEGPVDMIVNVPGPGRRILVGYSVDGSGFNILAPERRLFYRGSWDDSFSIPDFIWARNVQISAFTSQRADFLCP